MIEPMDKGTDRVPKARGVCDDCGRDEVVTCDYERTGRAGQFVVNEAQAIRKLHGWALVKGKLRCPKCEAKRKIGNMKEKKEKALMAETTNVAPLRQPTKEQKRQIVSLLDETYDTESERYRGGETDKTIAETIGGGCMPGWVAELREEMFGPDGGNDDIEQLLAELAEWRAGIEKQAAELHDRHVQFSADLRKLTETREKAREYLRRIEAIKAAVGPKARAV